MDPIRKVSTQTIWQLLGKAITSFSTVVILGIVSRNFGEAGTGIFTLALTYLAFFTLAIDFGMNAHLMSQLIKADFELVWRKLFGFRLLLVCLLVPLSILGGLFYPVSPLFKQLIVIGSLMAILEPAIYVSANAIFQSRSRYDLSAIGWSVAGLSTLFLVFLTTYLHFGLPWLMIDYSIGWLIGCLILLYFVKKFVKSIRPVFDLNFNRKIFMQAWPISFTLILNTVYFRLDAFILSFYHALSDVGVYNLSYQIFQAILVIPSFIMNGYYPLMLKSLQDSKIRFLKDLRTVIFIMVGLGLCATIVTFLFSPLIISAVTGGKGFSNSSLVLNILSLGFPAFFMSSVMMWLLISLKKYKAMLVICLLGLVINALRNLVLIPKYSYIGASWVTVASEYLILLLQTIFIYLYTPRK